jgi:hypothetical protein
MIRQPGPITASFAARVAPPLAAVFAAACAACAAAPSDHIVARQAQLTEAGSAGPAEYAWYSTAGGLQYEAYRPIGGKNRWHHLDVIDLLAKRGELTLEPGRVYIGGPAITGPHQLDDYVGPDGQLSADVPRPWFDMVSCDGDIFAGPATCRSGDRIEVMLEDLGATGQRVSYRVFMPDDQTPSVSGSFLAQPDTVRGTPR